MTTSPTATAGAYRPRSSRSSTSGCGSTTARGFDSPTTTRPGDEEDDVKQIAETLFGITDRGGRVAVTPLLGLLGYPEVAEGEDVLEPVSTRNGTIPGAAGSVEVTQANAQVGSSEPSIPEGAD